MGIPMSESTLTLCRSRLYHPVRCFGFGLGYFKVPRSPLLSPEYFPLRGMAFLWVIVANNTAHETCHRSKETWHLMTGCVCAGWAAVARGGRAEPQRLGGGGRVPRPYHHAEPRHQLSYQYLPIQLPCSCRIVRIYVLFVFNTLSDVMN